MSEEHEIRSEIVARCREMNAAGLNQGTSGNISHRLGDAMIVTPSGIPYDVLTPDMLCRMRLDDATGAWDGPRKPTTEWRFHQRILRDRPDCRAVVHAHPNHCTALGIMRMPIPPVHYMIAVFGGDDVRCADYALYGTDPLSDAIMVALKGRTACLMANHGMIAIGDSLRKAMWRAVELETLARQYLSVLATGREPVLLTRAQIDEALEGFASYGLQPLEGAA